MAVQAVGIVSKTLTVGPKMKTHTFCGVFVFFFVILVSVTAEHFEPGLLTGADDVFDSLAQLEMTFLFESQPKSSKETKPRNKNVCLGCNEF